MSAASSAAGPNGQTTLQADVLESTVVDEALLVRLLRRAGRTLARPALECFEMLIDGATPHQARITVLAALTYLVLPFDLIPDFIPVAGFGDDMVALTALLGLCARHLTPEIKLRAQRRLDGWFPPAAMPSPSLPLSTDQLDDLQAFLKDWLRHTGRTQADLRRALRTSSIRMPVLIEELQRIHNQQGLTALAQRVAACTEAGDLVLAMGAGDVNGLWDRLQQLEGSWLTAAPAPLVA